jgi:hypothetical protein
MAWESFRRNGKVGYFGDITQDELSLALKAVARHYEEQWRRKPTVDEVLFNIERLLAATPERYVSDPAGVRPAHLQIDHATEETMTMQIDLDGYEGVYSDRPPPGAYQVVRRGSNGKPTTDVVIRLPTLDVKGRTLICAYEVCVSNLDSQTAEQLIVAKILRELLLDSYRKDVEEIAFHDLKIGSTHSVAYP